MTNDVKLKKGTRVTGADRAKLTTRIIRMYEGGASIRATAGDTGRSYGFVHRLLTENGVPLRARGGAYRLGMPRAPRGAN